MIEVIQQQFKPDMPDELKLNLAREFLQILALKIMHDKHFFYNLAFTGGTALRILFNTKRFSEDLDFSLVEKKGYSFSEINSKLISEFRLYGLNTEIKPSEERTVHSVFLKFSGLLKLLGLSPLNGQKLAIKIEIDTNPPKGGILETTLINKTYVFPIVHFDLPSMFAAKLSACFYRKYTKGRDFYDFIWYISKKNMPNFLLLNNAIEQTQGHSPKIDESNFKNFLLENIEKIDFNLVKLDVERFLEDKTELGLFDLKIIKPTIERTY